MPRYLTSKDLLKSLIRKTYLDKTDVGQPGVECLYLCLSITASLSRHSSGLVLNPADRTTDTTSKTL